MIGIVVDEINEGTLTTDKLLKWVVLLVLVGITMYILRYVWRIMIFGSSLKLARQLRKNLYEHFTKMSPSFYQSNRTGGFNGARDQRYSSNSANCWGGVF